MKQYVLKNVVLNKMCRNFYVPWDNKKIEFDPNNTWMFSDHIEKVFTSTDEIWRLIKSNTRYASKSNRKYKMVYKSPGGWTQIDNPDYVVINNKEYWYRIFSEFQIIEYDINFDTRIINERIVPWTEFCPKRLPKYWD